MNESNRLVQKKAEIHKPLGNRILVKVDVSDEVKKLANSRIAIPDSVKYNDRENAVVDTGIVMDMGDNAFQGFEGDPWVKIGDRVSFIKHAGALRKINDEDFRILMDADLLTRIETNEKE